MSQYYFTVASLPFLSFTQKPPFSVADFMEICRAELKKEDYALLVSVDYTNLNQAEKTLPLVRRWLLWEINLRNSLVRLRAKKKSLSAEKYIKSTEEDLDALSTGQAAFEEESPVKAEEFMDKARWRFLEEREAGHYFDLSRLIIYSLKLQILEKRYAMQAEKGKEKYKAMITTFYDSIAHQEQMYGK